MTAGVPMPASTSMSAAKAPAITQDAAGDDGFARAMESNDAAHANGDAGKPESRVSDARRDARDGADRPASSEPDAASETAESAASPDASSERGAGDAKDAPADAHLPDRMLALLTQLGGDAPVASASTAPVAGTAIDAPVLPAPATALPAVALPTAAVSALSTQPAASTALSAWAMPAMVGANAKSAAPALDPVALATTIARDALAEATTATGEGATPAESNFASMLAPATPTAALAPTRATATLEAVAMPATPADGFDDAFGARIGWLAEQKIGHAELRVTPDNAGPIDVRLHIDGSKVRAEFNAAQPDTRQALEASLPRLREMLGEQGLQLAHADVGQRHAQQNGDARADADASRTDANNAGTEPVMSPAQLLRSRGLLDEYA